MHQLIKLREEFKNATKTVLKANISKNLETLNANCIRITISYNNLVNGINQHLIKETKENQEALRTWLYWAREKVLKSYEVLNCNYYVPPNFNKIDPLVTFKDIKNKPSLPSTNKKSNISKMSELNALDVLKLVSTTINKNYSGDPLGLQSFIDSVSLLKTIVTSSTLQDVLKQCILSKLEGKAREAIANEPDSVDKIIEFLKENIKSEKSQVIEGRMQALKADRVSLQEFSKRAEELAENLRRSLIMEGVPSNKAQEMTVEKTVQMCRASARSDLTKSVLASTQFKDPKDVVAKFIIEINSENQEKQILSVQQKRGNQNFRGNRGRRYNYDTSQNSTNRQNNNGRGRNNGSYGNRRNYNNNTNHNYDNNSNYSFNNPNNYNNREFGYNNQQNVRFLENQETPENRTENQEEDYLGGNQE